MDPIILSKSLTLSKKPKISKLEITIFDMDQYKRGVISENLRSMLKGLMTVAPTSTSAERTFSTCGQIISPIRTLMSPELLDSLLILKYFYLNQV